MRRFRKLLLPLSAILVLLAVLNVVLASAGSPESESIRAEISAGDEVDLYLGRSGVYFPNSYYTGSLRLTRLERNEEMRSRQLFFSQQWTEIELFDSSGAEVELVRGLIYVYFDLSIQERQVHDSRDLAIYFYDEENKKWEYCGALLVEDDHAPFGRLTCLLRHFGVYGLAVEYIPPTRTPIPTVTPTPTPEPED